MQVIPAIDVLDGRVVRLVQGDFARATTFGDDPVPIAERYRRSGATRLHLVNLSAARDGGRDDRFLELVARLSQILDVQIGGGIRDLEAVRRHLDAGAAAVVIGTMLFTNTSAARAAVDLFGPASVIAALDVEGDRVKTHGWRSESGYTLNDAVRLIDDVGIRQVLMTDIARDGAGAGPNVALYADWKRREPEIMITASGGVRGPEDIRELTAAGCDSVVVGRALLDGSTDLPSLVAASAGRTPREGAGVDELSPRSGLAVRIIPCLDVTEGRVVKGTNFQNLRDAGDPVELAKRYCDEGADELVFLDITATSDNRRSAIALVARVADSVNVPFTIGGGVRSVADARAMLEAGADKVSVNSAAVARPSLIEEMARELGSANTVCAIDARRQRGGSRPFVVPPLGGSRPFVVPPLGGEKPAEAETTNDLAMLPDNGWTVLVRGGRSETGIDAVAWAEEAVRRGAGELLVTSHDRDGTAEGFDTELLSQIKRVAPAPLIASGGAGSLQSFVDAVRLGKADAVLAASVFHFGVFSIRDVKMALRDAGLPVRR
ncbi:MAG: imidazole glycerol phosphate synthase subunit HisF [Thermoguttaceae bacterium]